MGKLFRIRQTPWRRMAGPLAVALISAVTIAGGVPAGAQDEKLPSAEQVLDRAVEAMGGKAAMEKIHNRVYKGAFEIPAQGIQGQFESYEAAPNKAYTFVEFPGVGRLESGTDGQVYWEITPMGARIIEGEEKVLKECEWRFNAALHWRKLYPKVECIGVDKVDGHPCYKLALTPRLGPPQTVYYEKKTGLPARMDMIVKSPMGEVPVEVRIQDYKAVDGVMLHHKIVQRMVGMEQSMTMKSIEHNVDLPASRFDLPAAVKELLAQQSEAEKSTKADKAKRP